MASYFKIIRAIILESEKIYIILKNNSEELFFMSNFVIIKISVKGDNMYLKEIKSQGFKSFADKTDIELTNGITGIVGPNGSGKSNVVDAVRWVLGEQSVKSLRGEGNMTDVIFSGSKSRNPMNTASVTLVFDNTDKYLPLEYDEVAIRRRVYKDGTNEYFLNNERVRLKDITNLLLDSGIAKESFNIISQGKIDEVISSKPTDRRVIFEEAAGVLKYKRRKEEAIRKLDKTHNNLARVNDIINELEPQIEPLKEAKEKALEYNEAKEQLEKVEIALITEDITKFNRQYQEEKARIDALNNELLKLGVSSNKSEAKIEKYKNDINKNYEKIKEAQNKILEYSTQAEKLNSRKDIITERKKYEVEDTKLHNMVVELKEKEELTKNEITALETDIININKEGTNLEEKINNLNKDITKVKEEKQTLENTLTNLLRQKNNLEIKAENLKDSIENGGLLPTAVKSVLNNPKLKGIHNVLGNLIETDSKYTLAISVALGFSTNNIIVDNETLAKEAINSIKEIGRATFFPLNIIKPKQIDSETLDIMKSEPYFSKIASDLVKYEDKYANIILNQLGNIIVTENITDAIKLSKKINYRYRIVTIDGNVIHVGGSMTGGKQIKNRNVISDKYDLEVTLKDLEKNLDNIKEHENKINEIDYNLKSIEDKKYLLDKDKLLTDESIKAKTNQIRVLKDNLEKIKLDIEGTTNIIEGALSKEEEEIISQYYEAVRQKEAMTKELERLTKEKNDLAEALEDYEISVKKENSAYSQKTEELKNLEISVNRLDVKLDNLLNMLSESYSMTYEKALENYKLDIEYNIAKTTVNSLRRKIKEIGIVNLAAPDEYDRVSTRYEFLLNQVTDLNKAENTLLEIIEEMDKVMVKEFNTAFKTINDNFEATFRELFKGGKASLKLTDPNNLLETGIEIVASPPGKKLTSISLLSGGEKTLTAISLLFAIIKSRPAPFCILDEVEAALDEVNVDTFGQYVKNLKDKSQFILITHKKKTMEYADVLYGITMQESGVSKLVSVKLEEIG